MNSIAVDPTNSDVLYLGSAGGGVWKTVDHGAHWKPMTTASSEMVSFGGRKENKAIDSANI